MANIEERVETLIKPIIEQLGYKLYDVQYVKESSNYYLRVFIEKEEGSIDLDDCEIVNNGINDILDTADYIKEQYFLEVSSTGLEKVLRKDVHLQNHIGSEVEVKLFKPVVLDQQEDNKKNKKEKKSKELIGILKGFDEKEITLELENEQLITIERKNIAIIKTVYHWDEEI